MSFDFKGIFGNVLPPSIGNINASSLGQKVDNLRADAESRIASLDIEGSAVEFSNIAKTKLASINPSDITALSSVASNKIASLTKGNLGKLGAIPAHIKELNALDDLVTLSGGISSRGNPHIGPNEFGAYVYNGPNASKDSGGIGLTQFGGEGGIANEDPRHPSVLPNVLNNFVSVNYVLSLGILDLHEVNYPDETYIKNGPKKLLIKSGGGSPASDQTMATSAAGKLEFFIDDLEWDAVVNPVAHKHVSTNTTFNFNITEPYSMGQFLEVLQIAALEAGFTHYTEAHFVLVIDWVGWDSNGTAHRISDLANLGQYKNSDGQPITHTKKYAPFKFTNATFSVNAGGCIYECSAVAANDEGLNDSVQFLATDISIAGDTVHQLLQTGEYSLTNAINDDKQKARRDSKDSEVYADHYIIQFPHDNDLASDQNFDDTSAGGEEHPAIQYWKSGSTSKRDVSGKTMIDTLLKNVDQSAGKINGIGQSTVVYNKLLDMNQVHKQKSKQPPMKPDQVNDESLIQNTTAEKVIVFSQGTPISKIIEEIILCSKWVELNGANGQDDEFGYKNWFKIECKVYPVPAPKVTASRGQMPKIYVYRVINFKQHGATFSNPTAIAKGTPEIRSQVCKKYDYIYTGKNKDIINFQIEYNNRYFMDIPADLGNDNAIRKNRGAQATAEITNAQNDPQEIKERRQVLDTFVGPLREDTTVKQTFLVKKISENTSTLNYTSATRSVPASQKQEIARAFHASTLATQTDMAVIDIEIYGDPYFISSSGIGNYSIAKTTASYVDERGSIAYEHRKVYIVIEFRTPTDIGSDGIMDFPGYRTNELVDHFSGIYHVTTVKSSFSKGLFKQTLSLIKSPNQSNQKADDSEKGALGDTGENTKKGSGAGAENEAQGPTSGNSSNSSSTSGGADLVNGQLEFNPSVATGGFNTRRA